MEYIRDLVIAYIPSITAVISIIVAIVKIVKENTGIHENIKQIKENFDAQDKETKDLKRTLSYVMQENAKLKQQNSEILTKLTGIKPKE